MSTIIFRLRKLFADRRGAFFVEYSSLALLIAIAALALFIQFGSVHGPRML